MPVKVKCPSCAKVFGAPDAAKGKLVKCPGCEEKVKVPTGEGAKGAAPAKTGTPAKPGAKKKATAPKEDDHDHHEHALKNLDLDSVEDENARVCPKCGKDIYDEDAIECPACGLNFETGLTKDKQKGVDPKLFFRYAWNDPWKFLKNHISFAIRTSVYSLIYTLLFLFCGFMVGWCSDPPPRAFWALIAGVTAMVPSGWVWFLNGEIIKCTMDKKDQLGRINFDMFTCVALGMKTFQWTIAMSVQFVLPVVGGVMIKLGMLIPGLVLIGLGLLLVALTIPQAMVHFTMPVTLRGWLMHIHVKSWGKVFGASAYWCLITLVVMLPSLAMAGIFGGIGARKMATFAGTFVRNFNANTALYNDTQAVEAAKANPKGPQPQFNKDDPKYKLEALPFKNLILPGIGVALSASVFGFGAVFAMRVNGLLAVYYKKHLQLVSYAKEVTYVSKKSMEDDPVLKKKMDQQKLITNLILLVGLLALLGGIVWFTVLRKPGPGPAPQGGAPADAGGAGGMPAGGMPPGAPGAPGAVPPAGAVPMPMP